VYIYSVDNLYINAIMYKITKELIIKKIILPIIISILSLYSTITLGKDLDNIEVKYKKSNPELFSQYLEAYELINNYFLDGLDQRDLDKANKLLSGIIEKNNNHAPAYRELARLTWLQEHSDNKEIRDNITTFKCILKYKCKNRYKESYEKIEKKLEIEKKKLSEQKSEATIYIDKAISIEPNYADAYTLLGNHYIINDELDMAKKSLNKAIELGGKNPWIDLNYSIIYKKEGKEELMYKSCLKAYNSKIENRKAKIDSMECLEIHHRKIAIKNQEISQKYYLEIIKYKQLFRDKNNLIILDAFNESNFELVLDKAKRNLNTYYPTKEHKIFSYSIFVSVYYAKLAIYIHNNENNETSDKMIEEARSILEEANIELADNFIDFNINEDFIKNNLNNFEKQKYLIKILEDNGIGTKTEKEEFIEFK